MFGAALCIAAAQVAGDTPGVIVDIGGAALLHRPAVRYPDAARIKEIQGSVALEVTLDATGNVIDAHVLSGPLELRKAALESVLQWHFAHEIAGAQRQVNITFNAPPAGTQAEIRPYRGPAAPADDAAVRRVLEERLRTLQSQASSDAQAKAEELRRQMAPRNVQNIQVLGLADPLRAELLSKLPLRVGDTLSTETMERTARAVREFDEHMSVTTLPLPGGAVTVQIGSADLRALSRLEAAAAPERIRVGGNVQQSRLIKQPKPVYPPEAKQARIQGTVKLSTVIAKDGTVAQIEVIEGHPLLAPAAMESVRQWVYQPTLLNGSPVEVATQIDVNFTLAQ
jgi:TonB family protein